ncbi:MAG: bifunctional 4'-phosphopantothenoylcysteine decarboxylase/phosphopantothenoylcysteine synthetase, partial [Candidatus Omnitrophica bacterium]|nr:bifunctional 4'-phosphopantothenoylcysteine decarboxylase/phosphopantothenoylcysteine synthetase [Candidatus Omnitrophota bacterium]
MLKAKNIILGVTASIAIYKACELVRLLKKAGFSVTVIQTKESEELIKPIVFQSLSGNKVYRGIFEESLTWEVEHISLADKADLVLIAPATANIIGKISSGICDDLLTCVVSATKAPVLIAPAMNENMFLNKITQRNIESLKKLGYRFVEPKKGILACGKTGIGCLAEVETIVSEVKK